MECDRNPLPGCLTTPDAPEQANLPRAMPSHAGPVLAFCRLRLGSYARRDPDYEPVTPGQDPSSLGWALCESGPAVRSAAGQCHCRSIAVPLREEDAHCPRATGAVRLGRRPWQGRMGRPQVLEIPFDADYTAAFECSEKAADEHEKSLSSCCESCMTSTAI